MRKPQKPVADEPKASPMRAKTPCVFCGERIGQEDKKEHLKKQCWKNGGADNSPKPGFQG